MRRTVTLSMLLILATLCAAIPGRAHAEGGPEQPEFNLSRQRHLFELGLFLGAWFPPRAHELYNPGTAYKPLSLASFMGGLRLGYLPLPFIGVELEGAVMPVGLRDLDEGATAYTLRGHVIGQLPWWRVTPFLLAGYGMQGISSDDAAGVGADIDGAFHAGVGVKWHAARWLVLRLDGRMDVGGETNPGGLTPQFELHAGASFVLGWKDPEAAPPPPADRDGDGVVDPDDRCPDRAGGTPSGCPPDRDGDGVVDPDDKCKDTVGVAPDGCPPDRDKDGVLDTDDQCPDAAGIKPSGCPDRDSDGVTDPADKCPDKPETRNGYQDADGCPDQVPRAVKAFTGVIRGITFETNSAEILQSSHKVLKAALAVLKEHPSLRLKIVGHTDDQGVPSYNLDLSQRRAQMVKDYLLRDGIHRQRLEVEGKGHLEPLVPGTSSAARAKNRRIEFKIITGSRKGAHTK